MKPFEYLCPRGRCRSLEPFDETEHDCTAVPWRQHKGLSPSPLSRADPELVAAIREAVGEMLENAIAPRADTHAGFGPRSTAELMCGLILRQLDLSAGVPSDARARYGRRW